MELLYEKGLLVPVKRETSPGQARLVCCDLSSPVPFKKRSVETNEVSHEISRQILGGPKRACREVSSH